ncbi:MAG: hypothetical protein GY851_03580 [bacterium]|nr:hypothetical protein [bacterium]
MKRAMIAAFAIMILVAACKKEEKEPVKPPAPPPPPPTAQKLFDDAWKTLSLTLRPMNAYNPGAIQNALNTNRGKLRAEENGEEALLKLSSRISQKLTAAHDAEQWKSVLVFCTAVEFFEPNNLRTATYRQEAMDEINRPKINVTAIIEDVETGVLTVVMKVFLPAANRSVMVNARVGDEFHDMRVDEIVGRNSAVNFTYLKTGKKYRADGPTR